MSQLRSISENNQYTWKMRAANNFDVFSMNNYTFFGTYVLIFFLSSYF